MFALTALVLLCAGAVGWLIRHTGRNQDDDRLI